MQGAVRTYASGKKLIECNFEKIKSDVIHAKSFLMIFLLRSGFALLLALIFLKLLQLA